YALEPVERALALGSFDGVHLGHQEVIGRALGAARERGVRASVATFEPHPMTVLRPELAPRELGTPQRQVELVEETCVDELVLIRFDHAFSQLTPDEFADQVLGAALRARHVVVGANFRYGHRAAGSPETLAAAGERLGFTVETTPLLEVAGSPVSSS